MSSSSLSSVSVPCVTLFSALLSSSLFTSLSPSSLEICGLLLRENETDGSESLLSIQVVKATKTKKLSTKYHRQFQ